MYEYIISPSRYEFIVEQTVFFNLCMANLYRRRKTKFKPVVDQESYEELQTIPTRDMVYARAPTSTKAEHWIREEANRLLAMYNIGAILSPLYNISLYIIMSKL